MRPGSALASRPLAGHDGEFRIAIAGFASWCERVLERPAEIGDVEPGTVEQYLSERKMTVSAQTARSAWVALRSVARFLAEQRIHHDQGQSMLRLVRMPKVKDEIRRALTDDEMWHLIERSAEGESGNRDSAIVWTLLGCGLRREELAGLRLGDVDLTERRLHVRAATTKSVHPRDVNLPLETLKALDSYIADPRKGDDGPEEPLFTDRHGRALTGNAVRKLFERLEARTGIRGLCATCCGTPGRPTSTARARELASISWSKADGPPDGWWSDTRRRGPSRNAAIRNTHRVRTQ